MDLPGHGCAGFGVGLGPLGAGVETFSAGAVTEEGPAGTRLQPATHKRTAPAARIRFNCTGLPSFVICSFLHHIIFSFRLKPI